MVNPIERKTISSQILDQLKSMIKDGVFPVASKLPSESELTKMFKVSRPPIREALSILEASGIIESKQGGGRFVKEINLADKLDLIAFEITNIDQLYDLLEMRTIIESEAAFLAAQRATSDDLSEIKNALDRFSITMEDESSIGSEPDLEFHHEIVKASKNPFLLQSVSNLRDLYKRTLHYSLKQNLGLKRKRDQIFQEHINIYESIAKKDDASAAYHMRTHLVNARLKLGDPRIKLSEEKVNE
ncbi:FadR/GntR family transcriptional regulator [Virgibacillus sp. W0181]|uniref:FadR/GntR family transcriptional regulator n=1 Tax=Virgibacillus sp. W0181 TaxID=3391581 RepID=UPI003F476119